MEPREFIQDCTVTDYQIRKLIQNIEFSTVNKKSKQNNNNNNNNNNNKSRDKRESCLDKYMYGNKYFQETKENSGIGKSELNNDQNLYASGYKLK